MATKIVQLNSTTADRFNEQQSGLRIRLQREQDRDDAIYFALSGHLDGSNASRFTSSVIEMIRGYPKLHTALFDLKNLTYIASSGIGAFVNILLHAKNNGLKLGLYGLGANVRSVFAVLGFLDFFVVADTREDALAVIDSLPSSPEWVPYCPRCRQKLDHSGSTGYVCTSCGSQYSIDQIDALRAEQSNPEADGGFS